jgi:hypothetical protein
MADGMKSVVEIVMATHAGMTTAGVRDHREDWIATARHPTTKRPYTEMVYQPMLEVLAYLRANGFKTFIVSGGGIEFMRPWSEKVYGIPPEQVIGSSIKVKFEIARRHAGSGPSARGRLLRRQGRQAGCHPPANRPAAHCRVRQLRRRPADAAMDHRRRGHDSRSTSTTPMPSANGPTTESPALAASTKASTKRQAKGWT